MDKFDELNLTPEMVKDVRNGRLDRLYSPADWLEYFRVFEPQKYELHKPFADLMRGIEQFYIKYGFPSYETLDAGIKRTAKEWGAFSLVKTWHYARDMWDRMMFENQKRAWRVVNELGIWELDAPTLTEYMPQIRPHLIPIYADDEDDSHVESIDNAMRQNKRWMSRTWQDSKEIIYAMIEERGALVLAEQEKIGKCGDVFYAVGNEIHDWFRDSKDEKIKSIGYIDDIFNALHWFIDSQTSAPKSNQLTLDLVV
jgi:hypothetical protein